LTRVIDFDAFRAEQKAEPLELKIGGHVYQLPTSLPAALALDVIRLNAEEGEDAEVKPDFLETMGRGIFGGDLFETIIQENGITMAELPELFKMVFAVYSGEPDSPNPETSPESETAETTSA
jgi:hypothetical protein